jgi:crotonobetainyl-CoA:carnitine CoA-transferase CaiB-like acyl-CoA transferase
VPRVAGLMKTLPTAEWVKRLEAANVPHAVVQDYAGIFAHEQTTARGMKLTVRDPKGNPVDLVGNPIRVAGATPPRPTMPPRLGEQTDAILTELGLSQEEVESLRARKVV